MNSAEPIPVCLVCCSVFAKEVETLRQERWPGVALRTVDSLLHLEPERLASELERVIGEEIAANRAVLLVYGDCCSEMSDWANRPRVCRTQASNCCELVLGRAEYRRLTHAGAFFLFPEWTRRWRRIFEQLGLGSSNAADLMGDMHRMLVYLDTGAEPIPADPLRACSEYCRLPCELRRVSLERLGLRIQEALDGLLKRRGATL